MKIFRKSMAVILAIFIPLIIFFDNNMAFAEQITCRVSTTPTQVTTNDKIVNLVIATTGLVPGGNYWVIFRGSVVQNQGGSGGATFQTDSNGTITVQNINRVGILGSTNPPPFGAGNYNIKVQEPVVGGQQLCEDSFNVRQAASGGTCTINFINTSFTPADTISFSASPVVPEGDHRVRVETEQGSREMYERCHTVGQNQTLSVSTTKLNAGRYKVIVRDACNEGIGGVGRGGGEHDLCFTYFTVSTNPNQGGPTGGLGPVTPVNTQGRCGENQIDTAIGCIPIGNANDFVAWFLKWAVGIAGGIAFLLIIFSGFQIMTSSNNPQQLQTGRELLTGAVSGLILIVFSAFLLKLIGVDILGIPGLGSP